MVPRMTDTASPQRRGWRSDAGVVFRQIRTKPMRVIELVNDCRDEKVTKMISYIFSVCLLLDFFQSLFVFFGSFLFVSRTQRKGRIDRGVLAFFSSPVFALFFSSFRQYIFFYSSEMVFFLLLLFLRSCLFTSRIHYVFFDFFFV